MWASERSLEDIHGLERRKTPMIDCPGFLQETLNRDPTRRQRPASLVPMVLRHFVLLICENNRTSLKFPTCFDCGISRGLVLPNSRPARAFFKQATATMGNFPDT